MNPTGVQVTEPTTGQTLREWITALLSLAIAVVALYLLVDTYSTGKTIGRLPEVQQHKALEEGYARQKDLLLYALALLGTVTGYYLGRVPAELHAQKADREAKQAEAAAQGARQSEADLRRKTKKVVREVRAKVAGASPASGFRDAGQEADSRSAIVQDLDALLDDLEQ